MEGNVGTAAWNVWHLHPSVVIGVLLLWGLYLMGTGPWRQRYGWAPATSRRHTALFLGGLVLLFFTLQGPLHELSDRFLFSAHMVQHLLITMIIPPLLLWGTPEWLIRPLLRRPWIAKLGRTLAFPPVAFALVNGALVVWHIPVMYDLALRVHNAHIVQHSVYLVVATIGWLPVISPIPEWRMTSPLQMGYLFLNTLPTGVIGSILSMSDRLLYQGYAAAPVLFGLSRVNDQVLGGLLMWVGGSTLLLGGVAAVFFSLFNREEREAQAERVAWADEPVTEGEAG